MLGQNRKNAAGIAFSTENCLSVFFFFRISTEDTHESGMIPPQKSGFRIHSTQFTIKPKILFLIQKSMF